MTVATLLLASILSGPSEEKESPKPAPPPEEVVVTATRREQPLLESVALADVLSAKRLAESPALVLDDHLRSLPGFSLFRRSSSLSTHPTAQGVSLRGIGPSGSSRSLVLFDGIPLNDPFGGWVYWNRLPLLSIQAIEVVRGSGSQLYGSSALGGTIQLIPRRATPETLEFRGRFGDRGTYDLDFFGSDRKGDWSYSLAGRLFDTRGFHIVDETLRGTIDTPANVDFQTFFGRVYHKKFYAGLNAFREKRSNGTQLQRNQTELQLVELGFDENAWKWNFYAQQGRFRSTFSRILPDRSEEFLTASQDISSTGLGSSFTWLPGRTWVVGADWRSVRSGPNDQHQFGLFVQDLLPVHARLDLLVGLRLDHWQSERSRAGLNPRLGLLWRAAGPVTLRASGYRGFRAPTLNELYRPFRVGNIETLANPELREEFLWGAEGGADIHPTPRLLFRLNGFWNQLRDPVANVTLSVTPALVLRQRQNLGRARIHGLELQASADLTETWKLNLAYLFSDAAVRPSGLRLPQVARHQASLELAYTGPVTVGLEGRWVGGQFEDDQNLLTLDPFSVFNVILRRPLTDRTDLFFAVENLFDRKYAVGRTPLPTLGTPRIFQAGVHFRLAK